MTGPSFGGAWTRQKLEILRRYLDTYTTALKDQPFELIYVDAFAGAGVAPTRRTLRNSKNTPIFELYFAASNSRGAPIAVRIADHILRNW